MSKVLVIPGTASSKDAFFSRDIPPMCRGWYPWLVMELLKHNVSTQVLTMPSPWIPESKYSDWANVFNRIIVDEETTIVGHSSGAGFILQYLSKNPNIKIKKLILVAPWTDLEQTRPSESCAPTYLPQKSILNQVEVIEMFYSTDDTLGINLAANNLIKLFGASMIVNRFNDRGHFWSGDTLSTFPELVDSII